MYENMKINFDYTAKNRQNSVVFKDDCSNQDFKAKVIINRENDYSNIKIFINPSIDIKVNHLYISCDYDFKKNNKIFVNGYQSWTDSREFFIDEKIKGISKLANPLMNRHQFDKYGDYTFKEYSEKRGEFHGFTYSYIRDKDEYTLIGSLSERNGYTIIEENINSSKIIIEKECKGLVIDKEYLAFDIVLIKGKENYVFDKYFELMKISKPRVKPMTGWTSWYNYYQNINEKIILENLNNFSKHNKNIDIFQIDDGYQTGVGDWLSIDKNKFPNGMKYIADSIKQKGYKAGIWLAPFVCEKDSEIYREKKHWILKDEKGEMMPAGGNWSGFYALDIYNDAVREYIKKVFSIVLNDWGYDLVKLDFLYAVCLLPRKNKTRGQIMTEAMEFLRECVGEKLILGCGVPLGSAFGLVDYCRIGCDISLDWDDKFYMKLFHRERVSTKNAIGNTIGRRHLDGRAFLNDPDVFLLRDDNITLDDEQKKTLSTINKIFGSLIFTSDDIKKYNANQHKMLDEILNLKDKELKFVECYKNGLVEVHLKEDDFDYLVLINLTKDSLTYNNQIDIDGEVLSDNNQQQSDFNSHRIIIPPFCCRKFLVK